MIGVIGAGAFGGALAQVFAKAGNRTTLWGRNAAAERRAPDLFITRDLADLASAEAMLLALPAQATESFLGAHAAGLPSVPLVLCAKGVDARGLRLQSGIAGEMSPRTPLAVLTGPGFASEIARGLPTALTLACADADLGLRLQALLSTPRLRLYLTDDMIGAQLGGALKNVIAIGCGMVEGAGLGHSARAALMTRGFAEMARLATALGARADTLRGLSGLGDLSLTCNSSQSRNFALGYALGIGQSPPTGTVEGVATARAACQLAARHAMELPIAAAVADVLDDRRTLGQAMDALLARPLKEE
jgi:glycerol-3-phosphate dehydrogenase (NAD(P)+)